MRKISSSLKPEPKARNLGVANRRIKIRSRFNSVGTKNFLLNRTTYYLPHPTKVFEVYLNAIT